MPRPRPTSWICPILATFCFARLAVHAAAGLPVADSFDGAELDDSLWTTVGAAPVLTGGRLTLAPGDMDWAEAAVASIEGYVLPAASGLVVQAAAADWMQDVAGVGFPESHWFGLHVQEAGDGASHFATASASLLLAFWVVNGEPDVLRAELLAKGAGQPADNGTVLWSRRLHSNRKPLVFRFSLDGPHYLIELANVRETEPPGSRVGAAFGAHGLDPANWLAGAFVRLATANADDGRGSTAWDDIRLTAGRARQADVDSDGDQDVIVTHGTARFVLRREPGGGFSAHHELFDGGAWRTLASRDQPAEAEIYTASAQTEPLAARYATVNVVGDAAVGAALLTSAGGGQYTVMDQLAAGLAGEEPAAALRWIRELEVTAAVAADSGLQCVQTLQPVRLTGTTRVKDDFEAPAFNDTLWTIAGRAQDLEQTGGQLVLTPPDQDWATIGVATPVQTSFLTSHARCEVDFDLWTVTQQSSGPESLWFGIQLAESSSVGSHFATHNASVALLLWTVDATPNRLRGEIYAKGAGRPGSNGDLMWTGNIAVARVPFTAALELTDTDFALHMDGAQLDSTPGVEVLAAAGPHGLAAADWTAGWRMIPVCSNVQDGRGVCRIEEARVRRPDSAHDVLIPALSYGRNAFAPTAAIAADPSRRNNWAREGRMAAPAMLCFDRAGAWGSGLLKLFGVNSNQTYTAEKDLAIAIDERLTFGSLGFVRAADAPFVIDTFGWRFPGSEFDRVYVDLPAQHMLRYQPASAGRALHTGVLLTAAPAGDYAAAAASFLDECWDYYRPVLADQAPWPARRQALLDALNDQSVIETADDRVGLTVRGLTDGSIRSPLWAMGFVYTNPRAALSLLAGGLRGGEALMRGLSERIIEQWVEESGDGLTHTAWHFVNGEWFDEAAEGEVFLRNMVEGHLHVLEAAHLAELTGDRLHDNWTRWALAFADWLVANQSAEGTWPRKLRVGGGSPLEASRSATPIPIVFLCEAWRRTGNAQYLDAARAAGDWAWANMHRAGYYYGAAVDNADVIDKESALFAVAAYVALYEADHDPKWLDRAEAAARTVLSWHLLVDIPMPIDGPPTEWDDADRVEGLGFIALGHSGVDTYASAFVPWLRRLGAYLGDARLSDLAALIQANSLQPFDFDGVKGHWRTGYMGELWLFSVGYNVFKNPSPGNDTRGFGNPAWVPWTTANPAYSFLLLDRDEGVLPANGLPESPLLFPARLDAAFLDVGETLTGNLSLRITTPTGAADLCLRLEDEGGSLIASDCIAPEDVDPTFDLDQFRGFATIPLALGQPGYRRTDGDLLLWAGLRDRSSATMRLVRVQHYADAPVRPDGFARVGRLKTTAPDPIRLDARAQVIESSHGATSATLEALRDGIVGIDSADLSVRHVEFDPLSDEEVWLEYRFAEPVRMDAVRVYWLRAAGIALPDSWCIEYHTGSDWQRVDFIYPYEFAVDRMSVATFHAVQSDRVRLRIWLPRADTSGLAEWGLIDSTHRRAEARAPWMKY